MTARSRGARRLSALRRTVAVALVSVVGIVPVRLPAQEVLRVERLDGAVHSFTPGQLAVASPDTVRVASGHVPAATYRVIALRRLLALAGVAMDTLRGRDHLLLVVAEGRDGYAVAFTLGELSPTLGNHGVLVAFGRDAQAIPSTEGPFRLLVPGDQRGSRAVRQLARLRLLRVDPSARTDQRNQRANPSATKSSSRSHE